MNFKFHVVYRTVNICEGHVRFGWSYIGKHSTNNLDDGYLGSGSWILTDIGELGPSAFFREVLGIFNTSEEALEMEGELVTNEWLASGNVYNIVRGGIRPGYGWESLSESERARLSDKLSESQKRRFSDPTEKSKLISWAHSLSGKPDAVAKCTEAATRYYSNPENVESARKRSLDRIKLDPTLVNKLCDGFSAWLNTASAEEKEEWRAKVRANTNLDAVAESSRKMWEKKKGDGEFMELVRERATNMSHLVWARRRQNELEMSEFSKSRSDSVKAAWVRIKSDPAAFKKLQEDRKKSTQSMWATNPDLKAKMLASRKATQALLTEEEKAATKATLSTALKESWARRRMLKGTIPSECQSI